MQYDKVYFQKEASGAKVVETSAAFDIFCAEMPFTLCAQAKSLAERDWHDEHGKDVYVPDNIMMQDYSLSAKFCCKGDKHSSNAKIKAFVNYLITDGGYCKIYDSYTRIGRQHVRFTAVDDDATLVRDDDGDILVFKVSFNVDDPLTDVSPVADSKGNITALT